jgi:hypothetical protein
VTKKRPVNPINPEGKRRGPAKKDVYNDLKRFLDDHTTAWERVDLLGPEHSDLTFHEALAAETRRSEPLKLSHADRAFLLIRVQEQLEYVRARHSNEAITAALVVAQEAPPEAAEAIREDARRLAAERERERDELILNHWWIATSDERAAIEDLRVLYGSALKDSGISDDGRTFIDYAEAKGKATRAFINHYGRHPIPISQRLEVLVDRQLRKRRTAEKRYTRSYADQLANLRILDRRKQALTVADWTRNLRNQRHRRDTMRRPDA